MAPIDRPTGASPWWRARAESAPATSTLLESGRRQVLMPESVRDARST